MKSVFKVWAKKFNAQNVWLNGFSICFFNFSEVPSWEQLFAQNVWLNGFSICFFNFSEVPSWEQLFAQNVWLNGFQFVFLISLKCHPGSNYSKAG